MRKLRFLVVSVLSALGLVTSAEGIARIGFGLGTPPLSIPHPRVEYMFKPNQNVRRFNNRQFFNEYGMRSDPIDGRAHDRRIIALGDSVLNGGNGTDHARLATSIVQERISSGGQRVFIGNASAGSWGPGNIRGYLETFGTFGADTIVLVLSSHDAFDEPTFAPLNPLTHPTISPVSALVEGIERYVPRYVPALSNNTSPAPPANLDPARSLADVRAIVGMIEAAGIRACIVQHATETELRDGIEDGGRMIAELADELGVPRTSTASALQKAVVAGTPPYRDDIHLNDLGQQILADALATCIDFAPIPTASVLHAR